MRLLERNDDNEFSLTQDFGDDIPRYAILSHTWGADTEEVTFRDLMDGTGKSKAGYDKIRFCGEQARRDGLQYFWVDTCCIDKSSSAELSEAIISMFRWYRSAVKCYVYLSDVSTNDHDHIHASLHPWEQVFRESRWFTRVWTLQELIAPPSVEFFCSNGRRLGDKKSLERQIHEITGIAVQALQGIPMSEFSVNERMSWANTRQTRRKEDKVYSLLGIFNIHMPLLYGEGTENAFNRLREEIDKRSKMNQKDILSWLCPGKVETNNNLAAAQVVRLNGTGTWLTKSLEYKDWLQGNFKHFWLTGIAGCGKTVLTATVVDDLCERKKSLHSQIAVLWFFFDHKDPRKVKPIVFLESIIRQLVDQAADPLQPLQEVHNDARGCRPSLGDLYGAATRLVACFEKVYLVVDALDECISSSEAIDMVIELSRKPYDGPGSRVKVFLSGRYTDTLEDAVWPLDPFITRADERNHEDIAMFARHALPKLRIWKNESEIPLDFIEDLAERMKEVANGLFIHAKLTIQLLQRCSSKEELYNKIRELPKGLGKMYNEIFSSILDSTEDDEHPVQRRIAYWLCHSLYCLREHEFASILGMPPAELYGMLPGQITKDESVDPAEVAFSHSTIEVYLHSSACKEGPAKALWVNRYVAHRNITEECIQYILRSEFASPLVEAQQQRNPYKKFPGGMNIWFEATEYTQKLEKRLDEHPAYYYFCHNIFEHYRHSCYDIGSYNGLIERGLKRWFLHDDRFGDEKGQYRSWQEVHAFFCLSDTCDCGEWQPPFYFAIVFGLEHIVQDLCERFYDGRLDEEFPNKQSPLVAALSNRRFRIAKWLMFEKNATRTIGTHQGLKAELNLCLEKSEDELKAIESMEADRSRVEVPYTKVPSIRRGSKCEIARRHSECPANFLVQSSEVNIHDGAIGLSVLGCQVCKNERITRIRLSLPLQQTCCA